MSQKNRILTLPNLLTCSRGLGIPLFLYLYLSRHLHGWAFAVIAYGGVTDYLDGKLARALNQVSKLGTVLDPAIDRLYIAATVFALYKSGQVPLWILLLLLGRDLYMAALLFLYRRRTGINFEVSFLGKAATFNLLYAFPLLLIGNPSSSAVFTAWAGATGWAFIIWGIALYLLTALLYTRTSLQTLNTR
jgi:cardiolipin synthase